MVQAQWEDKEKLMLEPLSEEELKKAKHQLKLNYATRKISRK
jgi:hypothetical protein